jgi:hypothetical protein
LIVVAFNFAKKYNTGEKTENSGRFREIKRIFAELNIQNKEIMSSIALSNNTGCVLPFLYGKIERMPAEMQEEVSLFADFLLSKTTHTVMPKFGSLKGKIHLSADFDAPLSDFKE